MSRPLTTDQVAMLRTVQHATFRAEMHGWMCALYRGDYSGGQRRTLRSLHERRLIKRVGDGEHFMLTEAGKAALL